MHLLRYFIVVIFFLPLVTHAQTAGFNAPDTVCVGAPVQLQNTSTNATTYFWNFCSGSAYGDPELVSIGNPDDLFLDPVFTAIAKDGEDYYVFVVNNAHQSLVRLAFGNSLLNDPVATRIDNINMPPSAEGIQIVKDATGWHLIVVGATGWQGSRIVTIHFGASLANNTPTSNNWGNIGNLAFPVDLYVFEEGGNYYGFTCNFENNTLTRFDFGNDLNNPPVGINLGNIGGLINTPTGIFTTKENGNWYLMLTNERTNELLRIDFGASLLNETPTAQSLGNPGNSLYHPRDISLIKECGQTIAVVVNGSDPVTQSGGSISRFNFHNGITGPITGINLGNPSGMLDFPHGISTLFRVDNELYAFVPNVRNRTMVRIAFKSCTNASIPSSVAATPPVFQYDQPGTYTVNLIIDEGLPSQQSFCRNIVVVAPPVVDLGPDIRICNGGTAELDAGDGFSSYGWSNGDNGSRITISTGGVYSVIVSNGGCTATDEAEVFISQSMSISTDVLQNIDCRHSEGEAQINISGGTAPFAYSLDAAPAVSQNIFTELEAGTYAVTVTDAQGCTISDDFTITEDNSSMLETVVTTSELLCSDSRNGSISVAVTLGTPPFEYALGNGPFQPQPDFTGLSKGIYKVYVSSADCLDSVEVELTAPPEIDMVISHTDETCTRGNGAATISLSGGTALYSISWEGVFSPQIAYSDLSAGSYHVEVTDANGCQVTDDVGIADVLLPSLRIITPNTTINIGDQIVLRAENGTDYHWEPADGSLSCLDCATTVARPLKETLYIVRTPDGTSCTNVDSVLISLTYFRSFFMPNAFSPNKDGRNDFFRPVSKGVMVFNMQIFNRWGALLFQTNDPHKGWDGRLNGAIQPIGTYVYLVNYGLFNDVGEIKMESRKGIFTLVR